MSEGQSATEWVRQMGNAGRMEGWRGGVCSSLSLVKKDLADELKIARRPKDVKEPVVTVPEKRTP